MRHENINQAHVAAAWPRPLESFAPSIPSLDDQAPAGAAEPAMPAPAVPDVAPGVGMLIVGTYAALIATFFALFTGSLLATMAVSISALFVVIFFTVPRIFLGVEGDTSRRPTLSVFMYQGFETLTGHSSGRDALVQMLIVPALLTIGILAMGIIGKIYL